MLYVSVFALWFKPIQRLVDIDPLSYIEAGKHEAGYPLQPRIVLRKHLVCLRR